MASDFDLAMNVLSIIGSVAAAFLSYEIYRYNRLDRAWLAVTAAFILIVFRRSIGAALQLGFFPQFNAMLQPVESVLLVVISALYIWGLWAMWKRFETFEIVEKSVREKVEGKGKRVR